MSLNDFLQTEYADKIERFLTGAYPWIVTALFAITLIYYLVRYFYEGYSGRYFLSTHKSEPAESLRFMKFGNRALRMVIWVLIMYALSRIIWIWALNIYLNVHGWAPFGLNNYDYYINKWDTVNYTRIAQYWYGFEDHGIDGYIKEYTIAFLPGFPLMIKALNYIVGDYVVSGLILSNGFAIGCGMLLYLLVSDMYSEPAARRTCFFFFFSCATCVFSATHSESAFMFLTLLAVYLARKQKFVPAVIVGAYATFTRQFGMFVAVPIFYEMMRYLGRYPSGKDVLLEENGGVSDGMTLRARIKNSVRLRHVLPCFALAACVLVGYAAYMFINWRIYGDPLAFMYYQQLNWGNQLTGVWDCVRIQAEYLMNYLRSRPDSSSLTGVFLPQTIMALALPLLMLCFMRRGDAGDNAYAWCYIALTFSSTWLLSGIRYIAAMYPLYIMLGLLSQREGWRVALYPIAIALYLYYNVMYCVNGTIV